MRRPKAAEPTPPRLVPAGDTDDGPWQVPDFADQLVGVTVAGTAPDFHRLPFEPPPVRLLSVGGTLVAASATAALGGLSNYPSRGYWGRMTSNNARLAALLTAIAVAAALRLVPHPPNFSPIDAMALFSGAYVGRRALAFAAPIAALLLSDLVLGFYPGMLFQYAAVLLIVAIGSLALSRVSVLRLAGAALAGSVLFFAISNFGVWLVSGMYPLTLTGLGACFVAAIPFFQNTVAGDLFYATLLFGGFRVVELLIPRLRGGEAQPA